MILRLVSFSGLIFFMGIAWALSHNRKNIPWRTVVWGVGLQGLFGLIILKTDAGRLIFTAARTVINRMLSFSDYGAHFLFGNLYLGEAAYAENAGSSVIQVIDGSTQAAVNLGTVIAFHVLPTVIFFGALTGILYHLGVMQLFVRGMAWLMAKTMKTSGAESLSAAFNCFVGMTEAPLAVKPFISKLTRSELMSVMTAGFATVAGGVMAAYVRFGIDAGHLLAASVMSAPAALVIAKILYPETEISQTAGMQKIQVKTESVNILDAAAGGASMGLKLCLNIGAMLLAFIALIAMLNYFLGFIGTSLKEIFGYAFSPMAFFLGVDFQDIFTVGHLLGTKISLNEFVAFTDLAMLKDTLTPRTLIICTYALCGFANFGSIAIQIGGIGSIAPERRADLAKFGLKAMFGGALASWMTACIAGILL